MDHGNAGGAIMLLLILVGIYFLPLLIALSRGHHQMGCDLCNQPLPWLDAGRLGGRVGVRSIRNAAADGSRANGRS